MSGRLSQAERASLGLSAGGLIIDGVRVPVPGVRVTTWVDDPKRAPPITDGRERSASAVRSIVLHTSRGVRGTIRDGSRDSNRAEVLALYQSRTARQVSWCLSVDTDGDVLQQCDAARWACWHAGHANAWTIGIEMVQHPDTGDLWRVQVDACVAVVGALCDALAIPKRVPVDASGKPFAGVVPSWRSVAKGGKATQWPGVLGHRNITTDRGPGDPGSSIFEALLSSGFAGEVVG